MSNIFVRVSAKHIVRGANQDDIMSPLRFDAKISKESRGIVGNWEIFGLWGSYKDDPNDVTPITLLPDGTIDFGSEYEADRYGQTNLRDKSIIVGNYFDFIDFEEEVYTYAVSSVAVLGEGKA